MYECKRCEHQFDAPEVYTDDPSPAGVGLPSGAYEYEKCPYCGSGDIVEAQECPACETHHIRDGILCDDCVKWLADELEKLRVTLNLTMDDFQDEIANHFGW